MYSSSALIQLKFLRQEWADSKPLFDQIAIDCRFPALWLQVARIPSRSDRPRGSLRFIATWCHCSNAGTVGSGRLQIAYLEQSQLEKFTSDLWLPSYISIAMRGAMLCGTSGNWGNVFAATVRCIWDRQLDGLVVSTCYCYCRYSMLKYFKHPEIFRLHIDILSAGPSLLTSP